MPSSLGNSIEAPAEIARKRVPRAKSHRLLLDMYLKRRTDFFRFSRLSFSLGISRSVFRDAIIAKTKFGNFSGLWGGSAGLLFELLKSVDKNENKRFVGCVISKILFGLW